MSEPHVVILGAGPAGLGAAFRLARDKLAHVTVLELSSAVGGNAGSFELAGIPVDYGSHRLHPSCAPSVLGDIRELLGADLLDRPRHGRIRLRGCWIHFPLKPVDLALRLPPAFAMGAARDMAGRVLQRGAQRDGNESTFASVLEAGLGRTICRDFYFPYARKLWGLEPEALSASQARRRVSASSPGRMARKVLSALPGLRPPRSSHFYYPQGGFGQISEAFCRAASSAGATVLLGASVRAVELEGKRARRVQYEQDGRTQWLDADHIWSTIPITVLAGSLRPEPPKAILKAAAQIDFRAMILIYLVLEQDRFTEYDAHYFPEARIPISRLSEPKNYRDRREPAGVTVLCAELPCARDDAVWRMGDEELGELAREALAIAELPMPSPVRQIVTRRLPYAYPIYRRGYETYFDTLDAWLGDIKGLLTFGRQGLFAHDNTHHALYMAYCAADCFDRGGDFDHDRWQTFRQEFETHVVED
jgi:protoporphyrinogen oxidase